MPRIDRDDSVFLVINDGLESGSGDAEGQNRTVDTSLFRAGP